MINIVDIYFSDFVEYRVCINWVQYVIYFRIL